MAENHIGATTLVDAGKKSKASVNYSLGGDHCGACTHFYGENEATESGFCELVAGAIKEDYWCKLFKRGATHA